MIVVERAAPDDNGVASIQIHGCALECAVVCEAEVSKDGSLDILHVDSAPTDDISHRPQISAFCGICELSMEQYCWQSLKI